MSEYPLLKEFINRQLVEQIAGRISLVHTPFERGGFVESVAAKLENLELKQRFAWVADKLREYLPDDYPTALGILVRILENEDGRFEPIEDAGFRLQPIPTFVYLHGLDHPQASLDAMPAITRHTSCEGAIRPYIIRHPELTLERLHQWTLDDSEHVRRLVSEGSRPRLPWWPQLTALIADPAPSLALLERLKDDPALYVRRSVANHLNDIGKDHPALLLERMEAWSIGASDRAAVADQSRPADAGQARRSTGAGDIGLWAPRLCSCGTLGWIRRC